MRKFVFVVLTFVCVLLAGKFSFADAQPEAKEVYYQTIVIYPGDTLWEIASQYKGEEKTTAEYVEEIMSFNKMKNDRICSGQKLILPLEKTAAQDPV